MPVPMKKKSWMVFSKSGVSVKDSEWKKVLKSWHKKVKKINNKKKIYVTQYQREDKVALIRVHKDRWILRSICGPAYFWNGRGWEFKTKVDEDNFFFTEKEGLKLLSKVKPMS